MDDLRVKKKILKAAEEVLTVLETQAAGFTKLTIPASLQVDLENKRKEVESLRLQIAILERQELSSESNDFLENEKDVRKSTILSFEDTQLLADLLVASQIASTSRLRRELLLKIGSNPEEYQLSGVSSSDFAKSLVYRLNGTADTYVFIKLMHEIISNLPVSLTERVLSFLNKLEAPADEDENDSDEYSKTRTIPSIDEIIVYTTQISNKAPDSHMKLLNGIGHYYRKTQPTDLSDQYVEVTEKLLNELEYRAVEGKWPLEVQEILLESLCLSGELAGTVKNFPKASRKKDFIRTARELGRVLNRVYWREQP